MRESESPTETRPMTTSLTLLDYDPTGQLAAEDWAVIDRLRERNDDCDPDEVFADATAAVEDARREIDAEK